MNTIKRMFSVIITLMVSLLAISMVSALPIEINRVRVEGEPLGNGINILDIEKGQEIEVKVTVTGWSNDTSNQTIEDVQITAYIRGNDRDLVEDVTDIFDVKPGVSYTKTLDLNLPLRMDQLTYRLRVRVEDKEGVATSEESYSFEIDTRGHELQIRDIVLSPESIVKAGRALLTTVRLKNRGEEKEEDIKVKVSIPDLGISASDYIDELDEEGGVDDSTTSEELYVRIPDCAQPGVYDVDVEVEFDDGDATVKDSTSIQVIAGDACVLTAGNAGGASDEGKTEKTTITVGPEIQDINKGEGKDYLVTITNEGSTSKVYELSVQGASWADTTISPGAVNVVSGGESKTFMVFVNPKDVASVGENSLTLQVKVGDKVEEIPLQANVVGPKAASGLSTVKRALEIGLVVLVVLLVILGLIIGFNKIKGNREEGEKEAQTYY